MQLDIVSVRRRFCVAMINRALRDRQYNWITKSSLGRLICNELGVDPVELVKAYKAYYLMHKANLPIDKILSRL